MREGIQPQSGRDQREKEQPDSQVLEKRSWPWSVAVSVGIAISATVNPLFDRAVHWDWMAGLAVALRNRWA